MHIDHRTGLPKSQFVMIGNVRVERKPSVVLGGGVYRLFGEADRLLYVGVGSVPSDRVACHRRLKSWWPEVTRCNVEWFADYKDACVAEDAAIKTEFPRYNHDGMDVPALIDQLESERDYWKRRALAAERVEEVCM